LSPLFETPQRRHATVVAFASAVLTIVLKQFG
jgi:hypothetical protein